MGLCRSLDISLWQLEADMVLCWAGCGQRGLPMGHQASRHGVEACRAQHSAVRGSKGSAGVGMGPCLPSAEAGEGGVIALLIQELA